MVNPNAVEKQPVETTRMSGRPHTISPPVVAYDNLDHRIVMIVTSTGQSENQAQLIREQTARWDSSTSTSHYRPLADRSISCPNRRARGRTEFSNGMATS